MQIPGERFSFVAKKLKIDTKKMEILLGVNQSTVSRINNMVELTPYRRRQLHILHEKYKVNLDWIETGEGEPFINSGYETSKATGKVEEDGNSDLKEIKARLDSYELHKKAQEETIAALKDQIKTLKESKKQAIEAQAKLESSYKEQIRQLKIINELLTKEIEKLKE